LEVADIFRRHGDAYRRDHEGHLGRTERRVMSAVVACRTATLGGHVEACADCGATRIAYNSCRNRHCPKCQGLARAQWLAARQAELLPVPYFHVVFTLPPAAAEIAFQNKAAVYAILMRTAAETLATIAADPKHLGAELGITAVLHSWGQTLQHHPHVHCVVSGGGPSLDGKRWIACRKGFFLPVRVLARLFRRLFLGELQRAFEAGSLVFCGDLAKLAQPAAFARRLTVLRRLDWIVYAKPPFGGPEQVLAYLGRYTHRVAIANTRLLTLDENKVRFTWKDYRHGGKDQGHGAPSQRVHPPLSPSHAAGRFPPYSSLRLPGQRRPHRAPRPMPSATRPARHLSRSRKPGRARRPRWQAHLARLRHLH
jgi:hypothetical protein